MWRRQLLDHIMDFDQPLLICGCRHGLLRIQRIKDHIIEWADNHNRQSCPNFLVVLFYIQISQCYGSLNLLFAFSLHIPCCSWKAQHNAMTPFWAAFKKDLKFLTLLCSSLILTE